MDDMSHPMEVGPHDGTSATGPQNRLKQLGKEILKRTLPRRLISEIRAYRKNPPDQRGTYLHLRLSRGLGFKRMASFRVPHTCRSLLFVCFGNIIRSPMCEALAKRELAKLGSTVISVSSAGLHATSGKEAHPWAVNAASEMGLDLSSHRARLLDRKMVEQADAIFAIARNA